MSVLLQGRQRSKKRITSNRGFFPKLIGKQNRGINFPQLNKLLTQQTNENIIRSTHTIEK